MVGALAGCSGGGGGGGDETPTATATDTATPTATATDTATPTATPTSTPSVASASAGETFTVGEGEAALRFTVQQLLQAQGLGPTQSEQAQNTFLLVVMTVENPGSSATDVPADQMKLRASGIIKNVDVSASEAVSEDRRLEVDGISQATIPPDDQVTGAVVFDAPTGNDYRLEISPVGDGRTYAVPVGDPADADAVESGY